MNDRWIFIFIVADHKKACTFVFYSVIVVTTIKDGVVWVVTFEVLYKISLGFIHIVEVRMPR
jgi:hypothetical protein